MNSKSERKGTLSLIMTILLLAVFAFGGFYFGNKVNQKVETKKHISDFAWKKEDWLKKSKGIRTSYNPDSDLNTESLTLVPGDERWLDFVGWCFNNKVAEHQVEAYGGTEWSGPVGGVIFHWAPGSRWETHTLASFGFTIGHIIGEHKWMDTQFPDFFEKYGGVYGVNVKDRLAEIDITSPNVWVDFLEYSGGPNSPYYRYLFHQEAVVDPINEKIYLIGGQGVGFEYTFERFYHEVREVLTDARAFQFFQLYDLYGAGFASEGGWAKNKLSNKIKDIYFLDKKSEWKTKPGVSKEQKYNPDPPPPELTSNFPNRESALRGQTIYNKECTPCHGIKGDGKGFLAAGFDVKPRDFRQGMYKFRSTQNGEYPKLEDIQKFIKVGVSGTTMPAWGQFLNKEQIADLANYLVVFSEDFTEAVMSGEKPLEISIPEVPKNLMSLAEKGKGFYQQNQCAMCHGSKGDGSDALSTSLTNSWDEQIYATDLTYKWQFKNGYTPEDIFRTFNGGLNGTPMPSYYDNFDNDEDRWALVAYVLSLSPTERPILKLKDFKSKLAEVIDEKGIVRK